MHGRTVLVTGASSGIGHETARELAKRGARVVLAVRDEAKGAGTRDDILRDAPRAALDVARVDLSRLRDVARFARAFAATHERLDVLVNNAGFHTSERTLTEDGHESTFGVNHLAHFVLTRELRPLLERSAPSRVVTVASEAHRYGSLGVLDDPDRSRRRWSGIGAYADSKLANILFASELARRVEPARVTSNAVHPGSVRTRWARGDSSGLFRVVVAASSPFLLSPAEGARTSVWAASAPELGRVSGQYLIRSRVGKPPRAARDDDAARRLWELSERLAQRALA